MTLRELKKSTMYQSSDLDDMEVMICVSRNGKPQYEQLCFLALVTTPGAECVLLGGLTEIQRQVESGNMAAPEGFIPSSETKDLIEGNDGSTGS